MIPSQSSSLTCVARLSIHRLINHTCSCRHTILQVPSCNMHLIVRFRRIPFSAASGPRLRRFYEMRVCAFDRHGCSWGCCAGSLCCADSRWCTSRNLHHTGWRLLLDRTLGAFAIHVSFLVANSTTKVPLRQLRSTQASRFWFYVEILADKGMLCHLGDDMQICQLYALSPLYLFPEANWLK
jgi:hypothetical protein